MIRARAAMGVARPASRTHKPGKLCAGTRSTDTVATPLVPGTRRPETCRQLLRVIGARDRVARMWLDMARLPSPAGPSTGAPNWLIWRTLGRPLRGVVTPDLHFGLGAAPRPRPLRFDEPPQERRRYPRPFASARHGGLAR